MAMVFKCGQEKCSRAMADLNVACASVAAPCAARALSATRATPPPLLDKTGSTFGFSTSLAIVPGRQVTFVLWANRRNVRYFGQLRLVLSKIAKCHASHPPSFRRSRSSCPSWVSG